MLKKSTYLFLFLTVTYSCFGQKNSADFTGVVVSTQWTSSKKTVKKSPISLVALEDCTLSQFKQLMAELGVSLSYDANLCEYGFEQMSSEVAYLDDPYSAGLLSYGKCSGDNWSFVGWYGYDNNSGLKVFLDQLEYVGDQDGHKMYRFIHKNNGYTFAFKRSLQWNADVGKTVATERLYFRNVTN